MLSGIKKQLQKWVIGKTPKNSPHLQLFSHRLSILLPSSVGLGARVLEWSNRTPCHAVLSEHKNRGGRDRYIQYHIHTPESKYLAPRLLFLFNPAECS